MNADLLRLLKEKMTSTPVAQDKVVEIQKQLGGEIFAAESESRVFRKTKSSSIACDSQQMEIFIHEMLNQLNRDDALIRKRVDIHTAGLMLLHEVVNQLSALHEPVTVHKVIDYLLVYKCLKTPPEEQLPDLDTETEAALFYRLTGDDRRTVNYYEEARAYQEEIRLQFLRSGEEKISVSGIHLLSLYVFQSVYEQIRKFYPQAVLDYSTFQQYVQRIPQGYELFSESL